MGASTKAEDEERFVSLFHLQRHERMLAFPVI